MSRNLIATLRGDTPEAAEALNEQGTGRSEVPLNSTALSKGIGRMIGALASQDDTGAVLDVAEVERLAQPGGRLAVSPNCDPDVIRATRWTGREPWPRVATDGFAALQPASVPHG